MIRIVNDDTLGVEDNRCWRAPTDGNMLSNEEDYLDNEYYTMNLQFFRLIGLCQKTSSKKIIRICFINVMLAFGIFEQMKKILFRIKSDWDDLANKPELVILKTYAEISRLCTLTIASNVFRYVIGSISETELILPFPITYFMKSYMFYYIGLTIEFVIILIVGTVGIANYSMFIVVIQHACALLTIVQWNAIERFIKNQQSFYYSSNKSELIEEREKILHIIKFYNKAIEFINLLKSFYESIHLLEEFFAFICVLLDYFYFFQIISFTLNLTEGLTKLLYIFGSLFIIYAYFYLAQNLINHNVKVFTILCQIPFYSLSLKTQNLLLFLIMRSMRPCSLSVKGAIVVSNDHFATLYSSNNLCFI
ncbi:uncharacterized protein LOC118446653 [Vespa mandarinia]|uniref:uncharacterized protein LOC118446653 n=1 Tax=Vespa mandarinia TaxID=7446 RepID=UPI001608368B|nr:uncharacterized protein LOC118446653 [Vespa mandarinia]